MAVASIAEHSFTAKAVMGPLQWLKLVVMLFAIAAVVDNRYRSQQGKELHACAGLNASVWGSATLLLHGWTSYVLRHISDVARVKFQDITCWSAAGYGFISDKEKGEEEEERAKKANSKAVLVTSRRSSQMGHLFFLSLF